MEEKNTLALVFHICHRFVFTNGANEVSNPATAFDDENREVSSDGFNYILQGSRSTPN